MSNTADNLELPEGFQPGNHDVVIGKGKKFYFHSGNQWLRTLVASMLEEYTQAQTKSDKSNIISDVVEYVRQHGRFVKRDLKTGKWVYAEPLLCREKCSQTFRDNLAETYRSSNVAKRNKRRAEQQDKKRVPEAKRMRVERGGATTPTLNLNANCNGTGMPQLQSMLQQQQQQQQNGQNQQASGPSIPSNLFDLDMPLFSPKQRSNSLLPTNLDFSALTRGSITGTAGGDNFNSHGMNMNGFNFGNFNSNSNGSSSNNSAPSLNLTGINTMNLMQNLPDILNNLTQLVNQNQNQASTSVDYNHNHNGSHNPFEPTPLGGVSAPSLPPLTGNFESAAAAMPTIDLSNLGSLDLGSLFDTRPAEKRHSLAMVSDFDWLRGATNSNSNFNFNLNHSTSSNNLNCEGEFDPKISAAFAA